MTQSEIIEAAKVLRRYKKKVTASKRASREFLVRLGVVDEEGNKTKEYKNLCIQ